MGKGKIRTIVWPEIVKRIIIKKGNVGDLGFDGNKVSKII
jgi:hypothetical protein